MSTTFASCFAHAGKVTVQGTLKPKDLNWLPVTVTGVVAGATPTRAGCYTDTHVSHLDPDNKYDVPGATAPPDVPVSSHLDKVLSCIEAGSGLATLLVMGGIGLASLILVSCS